MNWRDDHDDTHTEPLTAVEYLALALVLTTVAVLAWIAYH